MFRVCVKVGTPASVPGDPVPRGPTDGALQGEQSTYQGLGVRPGGTAWGYGLGFGQC